MQAIILRDSNRYTLLICKEGEVVETFRRGEIQDCLDILEVVYPDVELVNKISDLDLEAT